MENGVCFRAAPGRPRHRHHGRYRGAAGRTEPCQPESDSGRGGAFHEQRGQDGDLSGRHQRFCRSERRVRQGLCRAVPRPQLRAGGSHPQGRKAGDRVHRRAGLSEK